MEYDKLKRDPNSLPMQPGEASWASWKCGGGPHNSEFGPLPSGERFGGNVVMKNTANVRTVEVSDLSDAQPITKREVEIGVADPHWAEMPA